MRKKNALLYGLRYSLRYGLPYGSYIGTVNYTCCLHVLRYIV
jgi:hypothetical protein